jgi:hypothetical protein
MRKRQMAKEPVCTLHLRNFPENLRTRLRHFALDAKENMQDFIPRWLSERVDQEEGKNQTGKPNAKPKTK